MSETSRTPIAHIGADTSTSAPVADDVHTSLSRITQTLDIILERQDGFNQRLGHIEHSGISTTPLIAPLPRYGPGPTSTSPSPFLSGQLPPPAFVTTQRPGRRHILPHQQQASTTPSGPPHSQATWHPSGGPWGSSTSTPWRSSAARNTSSRRQVQDTSANQTSAQAAAATSDTGPTPLQVFRAMPREDKDTFRRVLGAMGTSARDFLETIDSSQLPPDALQRVAVGSAANMLSSSSVPSELDFDAGVDNPTALVVTTAPLLTTPAVVTTLASSAPVVTTATPLSTPVAANIPASFAPVVTTTADNSEEEPLPSSGQPPTSAGSTTLPSAAVALSTTPRTDRVLVCKPEVLGEFKGDPNRLEAFLSRVRDLIRSNTAPGWAAAVMTVLPIALKGDAAVWHEGLSDDEARRLTSFDAWATSMREAFPVNTSKQRRDARERIWRPTEETAAGYYFHKVLALRQAFGHDQSEASLVTDIKDGLPASMVTLLRLPRANPTLQELRKELGECEPHWRELNGVQIVTSDSPATTTPATTTSTPTVSPAARRLAGQSMVRSASAPVIPVAPAPTPRSAQGPGAFAARYDPTKIIPAKNGEKRKYTRANGDVIELRNPCSRCRGDHFNFEHDHLVGPQVTTLDVEDDTYPVVANVSWQDDASYGEDPQHFTSSAMTEN
ncbi:hypothetical protein CF319_g7242 [Tilletia indica]|nr:hypothetical protein CF319_g7242 [Tilletia indica]